MFFWWDDTKGPIGSSLCFDRSRWLDLSKIVWAKGPRFCWQRARFLSWWKWRRDAPRTRNIGKQTAEPVPLGKQQAFQQVSEVLWRVKVLKSTEIHWDWWKELPWDVWDHSSLLAKYIYKDVCRGSSSWQIGNSSLASVSALGVLQHCKAARFMCTLTLYQRSNTSAKHSQTVSKTVSQTVQKLGMLGKFFSPWPALLDHLTTRRGPLHREIEPQIYKAECSRMQ